MKSAAVMMGGGLLVNVIANYILVGLLDYGVAGGSMGDQPGHADLYDFGACIF